MTIDSFIPLFQYIVAFALSVLTSYIDISTFFQQKARFRISPFSYLPSILFFLFNGGLAVLFMSIFSSVKPESDKWMISFLSGLGTAGLLRSKLFTFGEKNIEFGFEYIYNFFKNETIAKLAKHSGLKKIEVSLDLAKEHLQVPNALAKYDQVANEISSLANRDLEKKGKFATECNGVKNDPNNNALEDKLSALIRVFIDYSDLKFTKSALRKFFGK